MLDLWDTGILLEERKHTTVVVGHDSLVFDWDFMSRNVLCPDHIRVFRPI